MDPSIIICHYNNLSKKVYIYEKLETFCENIIKSFKIPVKKLKDIKLYIMLENDLRLDIENNEIYKEYILEDININDIYCELIKKPERENLIIQENNDINNQINDLQMVVKKLQKEIDLYKSKLNDINKKTMLYEKEFNDFKKETQTKIKEIEIQFSEKKNNLNNNQMDKSENIIEDTRRIRKVSENEKVDNNEQEDNQLENYDGKIYIRKRMTPTPQTGNIQTKNPQNIKEEYNNDNNINDINENNYIDINKNIISFNSITKSKNEIRNFNKYVDDNKNNLNNNINHSDYNYKKSPSKNNSGNYNKNNDNLINSNNNMSGSDNYKKQNEIKKNNNNKRRSNRIDNSSHQKLSCKFIINNPLIKHISEIQNKVPIKYVIKLKNNGNEEIPKYCDIIGDPKSNLLIMETMVNNGNIILPGQTIEVSLYIFFKDYNKIQFGINQLNIILRHKEIGKIGEAGQIKINITDSIGESDKMIISQTNPDIRKKMDGFNLLNTYVGNETNSSINYNNK